MLLSRKSLANLSTPTALYAPTALLAVALSGFACSSSPETGSTLLNDELAPSAYAFNEGGLKLFTEGVRIPLAKSLEGKKWPLLDRRQLIIDLGPLGEIRKDVNTDGESWAVDPVKNMEIKVESFTRRPGGKFNQWSVRLVGSLPFTGWVKTTIAGNGVVDTTYDARYRIVIDGDLEYREQLDPVAEKLLVDFTANFTGLHGDLVELKFHSGLLSWDPVKEIVRGKLNDLLHENEPRWLEQANKSIGEVMRDQRLRTDIDSFYKVFDPEGDPQ